MQKDNSVDKSSDMGDNEFWSKVFQYEKEIVGHFKNMDFDGLIDYSRSIQKEQDDNIGAARYTALNDVVYSLLNDSQLSWLRDQLKQVRNDYQVLDDQNKSYLGIVKGYMQARKKVKDCWDIDSAVSKRLLKDVVLQVCESGCVESVVKKMQLDETELQGLKDCCADVRLGQCERKTEFEGHIDIINEVNDALNSMSFDDELPTA